MVKRLSLIIASIAMILTPTLQALAQTDGRGFTIDEAFDPNIVLTDNDVFSIDGMTLSQLTSFLRSKGTLADYRTNDIDGIEKSAPEIIWHMATMYQINPKYLVALLQKEQSLVEDAAPTQRQFDWAMGFGVCDSCSKDDPSIQDFKGFANQVYYAARQMREKYYFRVLSYGETISGMAPGRTVIIDDISVTPVNIATAALYTYTPHIHGNLNLWRIWRRWFSKNFPDGSLVKGIPSGTYYWIRFGERRPFASKSVAASLVNLDRAMEVSDSELAAYTEGVQIKFPNYSLLKDPGGKIWLIVGQERRHIVNMETFREFGFIEDEVEQATEGDLMQYEIGEKLTTDSMDPQGLLVQVKGLKAVWYAEGGRKHLLEHPALLSMYFRGERPKQITQATLDELDTAEPFKIEDGELVKASDSPAVYVIEHGMKRPIPSGETFESMGWKWSSIRTVPSDFLATYPDGSSILLDAPSSQIAKAE
ncbi:MAG: hypothetical protein KIH65_005020 [Candidatus Uhrbacteria bacterium]|nr:hypothetical protein [Candidatus Uhrbacteria bacterium]